jgi:pilus assembly protein CpaE
MTNLTLQRSRTVTGIVRSEQNLHAISAALKGLEGVVCRSRMGDARDLLADSTELGDLVIIEANPDAADDRAVLEAMVSRMGAKRVIVIAQHASLEGMRGLMRLGIADLLPQPLSQAELVDTVRAALGGSEAETPRPNRPRGRVVSVMKSGGGSGATTIAVHLAAMLARTKGMNGRVALCDLDLQFGSVATYLDISARTTLGDLLEAQGRLDESLLSGIMTQHASGVQVLAAPETMLPFDALTPELALRILETAAGAFDRVVLDLPLPWTGWTHAVLGASDAILLVMQLSVPGVRQARRQLQTLHEEGLDGIPVIPVANRIDPPLFGRHPGLRDAEQALDRKLEHWVPNDWKAVSKAVARGVTLLEAGEGKRVCRHIGQIVQDLDRILAGVDAPRGRR